MLCSFEDTDTNITGLSLFPVGGSNRGSTTRFRPKSPPSHAGRTTTVGRQLRTPPAYPAACVEPLGFRRELSALRKSERGKQSKVDGEFVFQFLILMWPPFGFGVESRLPLPAGILCFASTTEFIIAAFTR